MVGPHHHLVYYIDLAVPLRLCGTRKRCQRTRLPFHFEHHDPSAKERRHLACETSLLLVIGDLQRLPTLACTLRGHGPGYPIS